MMTDKISIAKEYFEETTVHGFQYVVTGRNRSEKIFWIILIGTGFMFSGIIIYNSILSWNNIPLQTTIEKVSKPIQHFPFPAVTICNHDQLQMPRGNRWLFVEQVLNWIDINSVNSNKVLFETTRKTEKDFQLKALRRKLGDVLENHNYKSFEKSCFEKSKPPKSRFLIKRGPDYFQFCGKILEYLVLQEEESVKDIIDTFYNETIKRWDDKYPACDRQSNNGYNVLKEDLFAIYEELYLEKHKMLNSNVSNEEIDIQFKCKSFKNSFKCEKAQREIEYIWKRLENRFRYTSICNLGSLVSNANFLLDDWKYIRTPNGRMDIDYSVESKKLHNTISDTLKQLYPNLFVNEIAFLDVLGLLGYSIDTDFASFDSLFYKQMDYKATASTLRPLYSFSNLGGRFKGLQGNLDTKSSCNLKLLFQEWTNYMFRRQDPSKVKGKN